MSVSASARAAKPGPAEIAADGPHRQPGRRGRPVSAETAAERRKATIAAACADLGAALEALPLWEAEGPTCDALEQCLQELLRPVHGALEHRLLPGLRPRRCGRRRGPGHGARPAHPGPLPHRRHARRRRRVRPRGTDQVAEPCAPT